ncbi:MAG: DUF4410 domain-containing protein [Desulfobacterales bacterium]|nr:DUF4410 domain-containing protein [Desulfobacterales bacterium]
MKRHLVWTTFLLMPFFAFGCASTKVSERERYSSEKLPERYSSEKLPRPAQIIVHDFAATPEGVAPDSAIAGQTAAPATPPTAEQIELGKQLGSQIAEELAANIRGMGLFAVRATSSTVPQVNDILIRGYFLSVDQGSELKRMTLGFGSGASELKTLVEGYQMTVSGPRKLGQGSIDAEGGKMPGGALGAAALLVTHNPLGLAIQAGVQGYGEYSGSAKIQGRAKQTAKEIADQLKIRFQEEGWIQ